MADSAAEHPLFLKPIPLSSIGYQRVNHAKSYSASFPQAMNEGIEEPLSAKSPTDALIPASQISRQTQSFGAPLRASAPQTSASQPLNTQKIERANR
jgi:hypothetical protein